MKKRIGAVLLVLIILVSSYSSSYACDNVQTDKYVLQILFGNDSAYYKQNRQVKMLLSAIYLCCEQADGHGGEKLEYLKREGVSGIPKLSDITISESKLYECSHKSWEYEAPTLSKIQKKRKNILRNTLNQLLDFGLINKIFANGGEKCNSLAAFLYYSHILADYLVDNTTVSINEQIISSYIGQPYTELNGNSPGFTTSEKKNEQPGINYSPLDELGRAGVAFGVLGPELLSDEERDPDSQIKPSGWAQNKYEGIINSSPTYLYNRCHLIAHKLGGNEAEANLITGTYYLNMIGMKHFELKVIQYIKQTNNHVLYRVTPIFIGMNKLASGVQIEAYSIEDCGELSFNVYCYNIQPGIYLDYSTGENRVFDSVFETNGILPFALYGANADNPDLIYEINKHLAIIFEDQMQTQLYVAMVSKIDIIANEARIEAMGSENYEEYMYLKAYEYRYFEVLRAYIPLLLKQESFFEKMYK